MARYCNYCERLYRRSYANCPNCGSTFIEDNMPDSALLAQGYQYADNEVLFEDSSATQPAQPDREQTNFYSGLSDLYRQQYATASDNPSPVFSAGDGFSSWQGSEAQGQDTVGSLSSRPIGSQDQSESEDIFGQYRTLQPPNIPKDAEHSPQPDLFDRDVPSYLQATRAAQRTARLSYFEDILASFPWRRIIPTLCVVATVIFLWINRLLIAAAIWSVVLSLIDAFLPVIVVVCIIIYILRSIRRH